MSSSAKFKDTEFTELWKTYFQKNKLSDFMPKFNNRYAYTKADDCLKIILTIHALPQIFSVSFQFFKPCQLRAHLHDIFHKLENNNGELEISSYEKLSLIYDEIHDLEINYRRFLVERIFRNMPFFSQLSDRAKTYLSFYITDWNLSGIKNILKNKKEFDDIPQKIIKERVENFKEQCEDQHPDVLNPQQTCFEQRLQWCQHSINSRIAAISTPETYYTEID